MVRELQRVIYASGAHSLPQLMLNDNSLTPIARYRRAKLGIVSRSRRAFLEVFPAGLNILDLVLVTFVSYAKHSAEIEPEHGTGT